MPSENSNLPVSSSRAPQAIKVLNDAIYGELKELKKQVDPENQGI